MLNAGRGNPNWVATTRRVQAYRFAGGGAGSPRLKGAP